MKDLLIISGPTAVGKTNISIKLAQRLNGEIISADSMQIYKYMNIGSAKVTEEEMKGVPHHLIDIVEPFDSFSAAEYKKLAEEAIENITSRKKLPIIAGGTGLYINSVICNYSFGDVYKDDNYRNELQDLALLKGNEYVYEMLKEVDYDTYKTLHPNNLKRIIRALEVYKLTGKKFSEIKNSDHVYDVPYNIHYFVINMDREKLYERINLRVDKMLKDGLIDEVERLKSMGCKANMQSMKGIGYKELLYYLDGEISLDRAIEMIKQGSRNYAKRQLTWFRKDKRVNWITREEFNDDDEIISYILNSLNTK